MLHETELAHQMLFECFRTFLSHYNGGSHEIESWHVDLNFLYDYYYTKAQAVLKLATDDSREVCKTCLQHKNI